MVKQPHFTRRQFITTSAGIVLIPLIPLAVGQSSLLPADLTPFMVCWPDGRRGVQYSQNGHVYFDIGSNEYALRRKLTAYVKPGVVYTDKKIASPNAHNAEEMAAMKAWWEARGYKC